MKSKNKGYSFGYILMNMPMPLQLAVALWIISLVVSIARLFVDRESFSEEIMRVCAISCNGVAMVIVLGLLLYIVKKEKGGRQ